MEPVWAPLERRLGKARCAGFMFMGRLNGINRYKHGITRTNLFLMRAIVTCEERAGVLFGQIGILNWVSWRFP
jgi:hypothetical protein